MLLPPISHVAVQMLNLILITLLPAKNMQTDHKILMLRSYPPEQYVLAEHKQWGHWPHVAQLSPPQEVEVCAEEGGVRKQDTEFWDKYFCHLIPHVEILPDFSHMTPNDFWS